MAEALGKALGVKVEYVQTAWPQLMRDFEADNFDIAMGGISITLDRQKKGLFSTPIMREGKTPIARCAMRANTRRLPISTNRHARDRQSRRHQRAICAAPISGVPRSRSITTTSRSSSEIAKGDADLMMTDASETRYQQKLHPGVLCAVHPDKPFDFGEKAYWLQRDPALKAFVDQWLHIAVRGRKLPEDLCRLV